VKNLGREAIARGFSELAQEDQSIFSQ